MYIYHGDRFGGFDEVPFDKKDSTFIKKINSWGKPAKTAKCKRAEAIQYCYKMLLEKGLIEVPKGDGYWLKVSDFKQMAGLLEVKITDNGRGFILDSSDIERYIDPLKVAVTIYKENHLI